MTQLEAAKRGKITPEMERVAADERRTPEEIRALVAAGRVVIPCNKRRKATRICGIGETLHTKVNANIGTSEDFADHVKEVAKLKAAEGAGADTVMDLSTGGDLRAIRAIIVNESSITIGSVPIYEAAVKAAREKRSIMDMTPDDMLNAVRQHCEDGVDFVTVHCGVTLAVLEQLKKYPRVCGVVSRGGTFLLEWMKYHGKENPLYERYDDVLSIAKEFDVTLSLGDGLRPGALADAFDRAQVHELNVLSELAERARDAGVQVMIEGPGHVPLDQIEAQVKLAKDLCRGAPFYVLGPLVCDIAPGYDHIAAAIGGAIAAAAGADFLCYVTPTEHLSLPDVEDVREGVIAARIAAHAADIAKGVPGAADWDRQFSEMRRNRDWKGMLENCIDPERARKYREHIKAHIADTCSMCGKYCVFKLQSKATKRNKKVKQARK